MAHPTGGSRHAYSNLQNYDQSNKPLPSSSPSPSHSRPDDVASSNRTAFPPLARPAADVSELNGFIYSAWEKHVSNMDANQHPQRMEILQAQAVLEGLPDLKGLTAKQAPIMLMGMAAIRTAVPHQILKHITDAMGSALYDMKPMLAYGSAHASTGTYSQENLGALENVNEQYYQIWDGLRDLIAPNAGSTQVVTSGQDSGQPES